MEDLSWDTVDRRQLLFNKVCEHLMTQGCKSEGNDSCKYRSTDEQGRTLMCAAGPLIADKYYNTDFDRRGVTVDDAAVRDALIASGVHTDDISFIRQLQNIHDQREVYQWSIELARLAGKYGLDIPECLYPECK